MQLKLKIFASIVKSEKFKSTDAILVKEGSVVVFMGMAKG